MMGASFDMTANNIMFSNYNAIQVICQSTWHLMAKLIISKLPISWAAFNLITTKILCICLS